MAKILIAEDEPDIRNLVRLSLRYTGHQVVAAEDGLAAVDLALKEKPDLVILDVQMPKLNGYDVCKRIKAEASLKHVPVIFLTVHGSEREKRQGLDAGAVEYLVKPFSPEELVRMVAKALKPGKPKPKKG